MSNIQDIKNLTSENFKKYGEIIEFTSAKHDGWEIRITEEQAGWRIALLEFDRKTTKILENHPTSKETFEPIEGVALLIVAEHSNPKDFEVFLLDKPICLEKKVWHQVISLSEKTMVKITENFEVACEYFNLDNEISCKCLS